MSLVIRALAGGRPVAAQRELVTRCALLVLAVSGCFYADPINQRPSLDIKQKSTTNPFRGGTIELEAIANDPEDHAVFFHWRAYACSDQTDCDRAPYFESSDQEVSFAVPSKRADLDVPPRAVHVWLEGIDDYGATARPPQQLWIGVDDYAPTLDLSKDSRYGYVVGTPVNVYAKVGDRDDGPALPQLAWQVFTPTNQPAYSLVDIAVPADPNDPQHVQYGKRFTPEGIGDWEIRVTASDNWADPVTRSIMVTVTPDAPPCLGQLSPLVAIAPAVLPMAEPTLFQVHVVTDDLDPYPAQSDPLLGTTRFSWSLQVNSGPRAALTGVTSNAFALDPANFQPGDIVELRVEIADRNNTPITCGEATCSVISDPRCIQRQTWRVEVR